MQLVEVCAGVHGSDRATTRRYAFCFVVTSVGEKSHVRMSKSQIKVKVILGGFKIMRYYVTRSEIPSPMTSCYYYYYYYYYYYFILFLKTRVGKIEKVEEEWRG